MPQDPAFSKQAVAGSPTQPSSVLDYLLKMKAITQEQYDQARFEAASSGRNPEDLVVEKSLVSEDDLAQAKASFYNIPYLDLTRTAASPEALDKLPESVAIRYKALPFEYNLKDNTLSVAMANPLDLEAIEFIEKKSGCQVIPFMVVESQL